MYKTKGLEKSIFPLNVLNISLVLYLTIHKTQYSLAPTYTYIYKKLMICNLKGKLFCEQHNGENLAFYKAQKQERDSVWLCPQNPFNL